jgi:hypothetical protein
VPPPTGRIKLSVCGGELNMTREQWFKLPLKLRQRYWRETDYGRYPEQASAELKEAIDDCLGAHHETPR